MKGTTFPVIAVLLFILGAVVLPGAARADNVDLIPAGGAGCGKGTAQEGDPDVAGCDTKDHLWLTSDVDVNRSYFEFWCIDDSFFGLRFLQKDARGNVILEKWVGVCPYVCGRNTATACSENLGGGDFEWKSAFYESRDPGAKKRLVQFTFCVPCCDLFGEYSKNGTLQESVRWDRDDNTADPSIPGDPNSTEDSSKNLLIDLNADNDLGIPLGDCTGSLDQVAEDGFDGECACSCRAGNTNTGDGSAAADTLTIDGSVGDSCREMLVASGTSTTLGIAAPPSRKKGGYGVWIYDYCPNNSETAIQLLTGRGVLFDLGIGCRCLPINNTVSAGSCACPVTFPVGRTSKSLGSGTAAALCLNKKPGFPSYPTSFSQTFPIGDFFLIGLIQDDNSINSPLKNIAITNSICIHAL